MNGAHYARYMSLGQGVDLYATLNTVSALSEAKSIGLVEPTFVSRFLPKRAALGVGPIFQVAVTGRTARKMPDANLAHLAYPHVQAKSASVVTTEDTASDYGDGSWTHIAFPASGDYNTNYAQVEYIADASSQFPGKVCVFLIRPDTDMGIGFVSTGTAPTHQAYFALKAGVTYKLVAIANRSGAGDYRHKMFSLNGAAGLSFLPIYTAKFNDVGRAIRFADMACTGII